MVSAPASLSIYNGDFSVDFQGAEKNCGFAAKERFAGTLKKSSFFDFLIIQIVLKAGGRWYVTRKYKNMRILCDKNQP